jgi:hypothetical protein
MDIRAALKSQYHAGLKALRLAVEKCPEAMWDDPRDGWAAFWRVAYHTLFFAHMYLQADERSFVPWTRHRADADCLGVITWEGGRMPAPCETFTREEILEYWRVCDGMVDRAVDGMDLDRNECGFSWYPMGKLEHQLVNIRHIQHHAAVLSARLWREGGVAVEWIGLVTG